MGNIYYEIMIEDLWRVGKVEEAQKLYEDLLRNGLLKSEECPRIQNWFNPSESISKSVRNYEKWMNVIRSYIEKEPDYITKFLNGFKNDTGLTEEEMWSRLTSIDDKLSVEIKEGKCEEPEITLVIAAEFFGDVLKNLSRVKHHSKYVADVFRVLEKLEIED